MSELRHTKEWLETPRDERIKFALLDQPWDTVGENACIAMAAEYAGPDVESHDVWEYIGRHGFPSARSEGGG